MNHRTLGIAAMMCAPFLFVDFITNGTGESGSWTMGLFDMIYMTGWMCSIYGLYRLNATGKTRWGKSVLAIQIIFLSIAQVWNLLVVLQVNPLNTFFRITDMFWPISNAFMLATGVTVITARVLKGWKRFVPLAVGSWLPFMILVMVFVPKPDAVPTIAGPYSMIMWALLGYLVYSTKPGDVDEAREQWTPTFNV